MKYQQKQPKLKTAKQEAAFWEKNSVIDFLGELEVVDDFLPPPEKLVLKQSAQKVTITLSTESVAFFKYHARKNHFPYQKMIRQVLDSYVARYQKSK